MRLAGMRQLVAARSLRAATVCGAVRVDGIERTNLMNRPRLARVLGGVLAALLLVPAVRAADEKPSQPRAVLVGISKYADKQIKARKHAENDAKALYDLVTNNDYLGIAPKNVRLLLGKEDEKRNS